METGVKETAFPVISEITGDVAVSHRSLLSVFSAMITNPLKVIPPEAFHEPLVVTRDGGKLRVFITDPALIHEALTGNAAVLGKGEDTKRGLGPALGEGLLTADGAHWKWQRQSVAQGFRHEKLLAFLPAMIAAAERTRARWLETAPGAELDIGHEMMHTTFDIIVETMMSGQGEIDVEAVERNITRYLEGSGWNFAMGLLKAPAWLPFPGRAGITGSAGYLRSTLSRVVAERRHASEPRQDLLGLLLSAVDPESGRRMSDEQVVDNLLTFVMAGHETTALGLAWTFHLLAGNPEIEARAVAEIEAVTSGTGTLLPDQVARLVYTRQVFQEAMRLYPPAAIIPRVALADFQLGRHTIPAGAAIYVPIYAVHRHASLWEEPERFDPDRFDPERAKGRHRYAYMPFGAGPRTCIGSAFAMLEAVAILAVLLKGFSLRHIDRRGPRPKLHITLRPDRRLRMTAVQRRSSVLRLDGVTKNRKDASEQ
ncbi:cytochrome P450 [Labrys okinawensis]|uniref:Cytochrome P450 n=1 Tax=Labrys okinawensis TaxID=346911 RepID=A0A2S9QD95_9HYPH|nr:cytochrome P450 [Labrys okinawensis]